MKNLYKLFTMLLVLALTTNVTAQLEGAYKIAPEAGALGVGPGQGDVSWWSSSAADVETRACFFDDVYFFHSDGTFENILQDETWLEGWQGVSEDGCGAPVAPHDGSGDFTYTYDAGAGTVTIDGTGGYLGIPKVHNTGELGAPGDAPESITYIIDIQEGGDVLVVDIDFGGGWWRFKLVADDYTPPSGPIVGQWQMLPEAGALGVGPGQGDISWWSIDAQGVIDRACYFDDYYVFNEDGTFENVLQDETWLETWQGASEEGCGAPVAPHNGANDATWTYDEAAGTLTVNAVGAYLGLPKVHNNGELTSPADAPESITYVISFENNGNTMVVDIDFGGGWWRYKLAYMGSTAVSDLVVENTTVFPNPAQDFISFSDDFVNAKIYSISGNLVTEIRNNQERIDITNIQSGVYFVEMITVKGELKKSKFIKK